MKPRLVWLCILVSLSFLLRPVASSAASPETLRVIVDGHLIRLNPKALMVAGRVLVPLRGTVEAMGASVSFIPPRTIFIIRGGRTLQLEIGSQTATVNDTRTAMDVPPLKIRGYTYIPIRFVSESLGARVRFDRATRTVEIITTMESDESFPAPPEPENQPSPAPLPPTGPPVDVRPIPSPVPSPLQRPARPTVIFPLPGTSVGNPIVVQGTAPGANRVRVTVTVPFVAIPIGSAEASVLPIVGAFSASVGYPSLLSGLPLTINVVAIDGAGMESEPATVVVRQ